MNEFGDSLKLSYNTSNSTVMCSRNISGKNLTNLTACGSVDSGIPREMVFNDDSLISVVAYSCLFVIAACGNLTVFITLFRNRNIKSRVNLFILHLSIADLIVTFLMLPLETVWHVTVAWKAGDTACRILMFFRAFGFYLSSFILVTISLDRYFAIMHPLSLNDADKRGKIMLCLAWMFSLVASIPQSVIFHVERHPKHTWFTQCVTFNFFPTPVHELAYNLFNVIAVYALPLLIISVAYSLILCEISKKSKQSRNELQEPSSKVGLRRSAVGNIERARIRTLKMTLVIVGVFVMCWTPYFVISAWWWFDKDTAKNIDPKIQRGLFLFAVSNSCMDPIVYGMFTINFKREFQRCCCCLRNRWIRRKLDKITGNASKTATLPPNGFSGRLSQSSMSSRVTERIQFKSSDTASGRFIQNSVVTPTCSRMSLVPLSRENSISRANMNNFVGL
ncbi:gonadotropin-releasing hormone II receptor-like [Gigantopelta aegis]|uniref:gonadotropin-releasing hormone II receptor-like n=1 Tax=Gigantopelta aegis TaxID=1735272 RepID=UPI001B88DBB6|nr:gonadotropin-releasing hormone II receptor-like [Gigantopelta aegis]